MTMGTIKVKGLQIITRIGVPDEERSTPQELRVNLVITPLRTFSEMGDDVSHTVDYHAVCLELQDLADQGERRLIETLADEMADHILQNHQAQQVEVEIRKRILPQTEWVGVSINKSRTC